MSEPEPEAVGDHWDHLERLFAEQYRREFENEENVWRSLPFFSATLALQVAVVVQVAPLVPAVEGRAAWLAVVALVVLNAALACGVLYLLGRSIGFAGLSYIAAEPDLLAYVAELDRYFERHGPPVDAQSETPKDALRHLLIEQYAAAAKSNRETNQARARVRRRAGGLLIASLLTTMVLAGAAVGPQLLWGTATGDGHGQGAPTRSGRAGVTGGSPPPGRVDGAAEGRQAAPPQAAPDANRDQDLVEHHRARGDDRGGPSPGGEGAGEVRRLGADRPSAVPPPVSPPAAPPSSPAPIAPAAPRP